MIEVFKTSVEGDNDANEIMKTLHREFPALKINFDLTDADKILRVETPGNPVPKDGIESLVKTLGFTCEALPE